jgi:hypothetical protein
MEMHPSEFVTVNVYVLFCGIAVTVVLVPLPVVDVPPGVRTKVQVPLEGNPPRTTLPVDTAQVGCVMVPTIGAVGVAG